MKVKICFSVLGMMLIFSQPGFGAMESSNYSITTSVISGGGAPMGSASFQNNSTLGQPSPLMNPDDPPYSSNYYLYPGFWYTLESVLLSACMWEFEPLDGDVDGSDLAEFAPEFDVGTYNFSDLADFAAEFGRTDCSD